jgi:ureidoglycolate hydrolase
MARPLLGEVRASLAIEADLMLITMDNRHPYTEQTFIPMGTATVS